MIHQPKLPRDDVNAPASSPLRDVVLLLVGIGGVVALVLAVTVALIDRIVPHVPPSWETRIFPRAFLPEADGGGSPAQIELLQRLLDEISEHWTENPYDLEVGIFDAEDVNALALPGGTILVTTGLMDAAETENELSFVLGHELGHFRNRDHLRGLSRGLVSSLVFATIGGDGALDVVMMGNELAFRSYDREQESDADVFGMELVLAEYGHVNGATDFFSRIPDESTGLARRAEKYVSTHPVSELRVVELTTLAAERGWPLGGETVKIDLPASEE